MLKHIEYLVSRNDCVIIPGFGAILSQRKSAKYDANSHTMLPPQRYFTYNRDLADNDGCLAMSIARKEGISYPSAISKISSQVDDIHRTLRDKGHIHLGLIGTFSFDSESNSTTFSPSADDVLSVDTCGLPAVRVRQEHEVIPSDKANPQIVHFKTSPWVKFVRAAASIALLIGICFVASTPISIDDATLAALMPTIKQASPEALIPADSEDAYIDSEIYDTYTADQQAESSQPIYIDSEIQDTYRPCVDNTITEEWVIVVASFKLQSEVEAFLAQHSADNLQYYKTGSNYRVYSASYPTSQEAYRGLANSGAISAQAWITKK